MSFININFKDGGLQYQNGLDITFTPKTVPNTTASLLIMGDPETFTTDVTGSITGTIAPGYYDVTLFSDPVTDFIYFVDTGSQSTVVSASTVTGSAPGVYFNLAELDISAFANNFVNITPASNYPRLFSGSVITLATTSSVTDVTGSVVWPSLVPQTYQVDCIGPVVTTTFFISVPAFPSGSNNGVWNAKDLRVVKPQNGIVVRLSDADKSYILTVSASDARYIHSGDGVSVFTASHAITAEFAYLADVARFCSASVTFASSSLTASLSNFSTAALTASYASSSLTSSYLSGSNAVVDTLSVKTILPIGSTIGTPTNPFSFVYATNFIGTASVAQNVTFIFTGSNLPVTASQALTASFAQNAGKTLITGSLVPITASQALTASNVATASYALNATNINLTTGATYTITSSWAVNASTASFVSNAQSASFVANAKTASFATSSLTASYVVQAISASFATFASSSNCISASHANLADTATNAPLYVLKAGDNVSGPIVAQSGGSFDLSNSSNGIRFRGATNDDFQISIFNNNILAINAPPATASFYISASTIMSASLAGTASWAVSASCLPPRTPLSDLTLTWDADLVGSVVGFAIHPAKGLEFFYQTTSSSPVIIFRTVGSQSLWQGVQSFTTASGFWLGTGSWAVNTTTANTASFLNSTASHAISASEADFANTTNGIAFIPITNQTSLVRPDNTNIVVGANTFTGLYGPNNTLILDYNSTLKETRLWAADGSQVGQWTGSQFTLNNVTASLFGTASVASALIQGIVLTGEQIDDSSFIWHNDPHSNYELNELGGTPLTVEYTYNDGGNGVNLFSLSTSSVTLGALGFNTDIELYGNVTVNGGLTSSLQGTASFATKAGQANTASIATTASYVNLTTVQTASLALQAQTASYVAAASIQSASFATAASTASLLIRQDGTEVIVTNAANTNTALASNLGQFFLQYNTATQKLSFFDAIGNVIGFNTGSGWTLTNLTASLFGTASYAVSASFITGSNVKGQVSSSAFASLAQIANSLSFTPTASLSSSWASSSLSASVVSKILGTSGSNVFIDSAGAIHLRDAITGLDWALTDNAGSGTDTFIAHALRVQNLTPATSSLLAVDTSGNIIFATSQSSVLTASYLAGPADFPFVITDGTNSSSFTPGEIDVYGGSINTQIVLSEGFGNTATWGIGTGFGFLRTNTNGIRIGDNASLNVISLTGSKVGINVLNPFNTFEVAGNVSASNVTASTFFGTASWAINTVNGAGSGTTLFTGSLYFITSSWAQSASVATTASYALTATATIPPNITASVFGTASWANNLTNWPFLNSVGNTPVTSANNFTAQVAAYPTQSFSSGFVQYTIYSASVNQQVGTLESTWLTDGVSISFTQHNAPDIGDCSAIILTMDLSASYVRLLATNALANVAPYYVSSSIKFL